VRIDADAPQVRGMAARHPNQPVTTPKPDLDPPSIPAPPRQLSSYEVEKKLKAIDRCLDFLNTEMQPTIDQGQKFRELAWEVFQNPERNAAYEDSPWPMFKRA
jgi:hypothetical protein